MSTNLSRFIKAQEQSYDTALGEIKAGQKRSHWMWYIFPQYKGLGRSETSVFYAINSLEEAGAYLSHPILGFRLREITSTLLKLEGNDARSIFGRPDDMKLRSCMTLFSEVEGAQDNIFSKVIDKFFEGKKDYRTLEQIT